MESSKKSKKANAIDIPVSKMIEIELAVTSAITQFASERMIPQIGNFSKSNDQNQAIIGTYYRMYGWMRSLVAMNSDPIHFQGAAAAARALFELLLDIKLVAEDKNGEMAAKFHAFPEVEKYRVADQLVKFVDQHPGSNLNVTPQRNFVQTRQATIDQTIIKHWGKNKKENPKRPKHWSGTDNACSRANKLGNKYSEWYENSYRKLSWFIHSGATCYEGLSEDTFKHVCVHAHRLARKFFLEATSICGQAISIDGFDEVIEDLRNIPDKIFNEEKIKWLEEQARQGEP